MKNEYDYEWITKELDRTIFLNLVDINNKVCVSYQPQEILNITGDDILVKESNIHDLNSLINFGVIRFIDVNKNDILDIPIKKLYKLYENPNTLLEDNINFSNNKIRLANIDAFSLKEAREPDKFYLISTLINTPNKDLINILNITKDYNDMNMSDKFTSLKYIDDLNKEIENSNQF